MNFILLEDDEREGELHLTALERHFPKCRVTRVTTVMDFLWAIESFPRNKTIIIMEHVLVLGPKGREHERTIEQLTSNFPEVLRDWDKYQAGERLVRYMRKIDLQTPVLIYTHSESEWIATDVLQDPFLRHCVKNPEFKSLIKCLKEMIDLWCNI